MLKLFCDKCGKELFEGDKQAKLKVKASDESQFKFDLCDDCTTLFIAFMRAPAGVVPAIAKTDIVVNDCSIDESTIPHDENVTPMEQEETIIAEYNTETKDVPPMEQVVENVPPMEQVTEEMEIVPPMEQVTGKSQSEDALPEFFGVMKYSDTKQFTWDAIKYIFICKDAGHSTKKIGEALGVTYSVCYSIINRFKSSKDDILNNNFPTIRPDYSTRSRSKGKAREANDVLEETPISTEKTDETQDNPEEVHKSKKYVDFGKVRALRKAGWSISAIAGEMRYTEEMVVAILNKK